MTPNYYESYDVGTYHEGEYEEIFNSDKDVYSGNNQYNGGRLISEGEGGPEGRPHRMSIKLGGFCACFFVRKQEEKKPQPKAKKATAKTKKTANKKK